MERFFSMVDTGDFRFNDELRQKLSVVLKKADFDEEKPISLVHVDNTCKSYHSETKKEYNTLSLKEAVDKMDATIKSKMGRVRMGSFVDY